MKHGDLFIFILFWLTGCNNQIDIKLTEPDSVWLYAIKDATNDNREKMMKLQFYENGIADEADTDFINFRWSYSSLNKSIIINGQQFKVMSVNDSLILMKHGKTGLEASLRRIQ